MHYSEEWEVKFSQWKENSKQKLVKSVYFLFSYVCLFGLLVRFYVHSRNFLCRL
jgi:heme/copper-type cytochrome/quinol oxidase subunit 3